MDKRIKRNLVIWCMAVIGFILIVWFVWGMTKEFRFNKYHNKTHGFSIKYPSSWSLKENKDGAAAIFYSPLETKLDFFHENVNVVVQNIAANPMDLEEYSKLAVKQMRAVFKDNLITVEEGATRLAGLPAYKFQFVGKGVEGDLRYLSVWTLDGFTAYQVTYTSMAPHYETYILKVKVMLRSFRID